MSAVADRLDELLDARLERRDAHATRIDQAGRSLGAAVARGEATLEDAKRRLDGLVRALDPEDAGVVELRLVPFRVAEHIAAAAFAAGVRSVRRVA